MQLGGVPRVLERLRIILEARFPYGPVDPKSRHFLPFDDKSIFNEITTYVYETWNFDDLGETSDNQVLDILFWCNVALCADLFKVSL